MKNHADALHAFASRIAAPQLLFLASFSGVFFLVNVVLSSFAGPSLFAAFVLAAFGYIAYLVDVQTFEVCPTFFATERTTQFAEGVLVVESVLIGFLAFISPAEGVATMAYVAIVLIKLTVAASFAACAFRDFEVNVYPLLLKYADDPEAYAIEMAAKKELVAAERRQATANQQAVLAARGKVFTFFALHQRKLGALVDETWLYAQVRSEIPDDATDQEAFSGAAKILADLDQHLKVVTAKQDEQHRRHDERKREIAQQLAQIDDDIRKLRASKTIDDEIRQTELASLEEQRKRIQKQQSQLSSNT